MPADRCSFGPHRRPYDRRFLQPVGTSELDAWACRDCMKAMSEEALADLKEMEEKNAAPSRPFGPVETTKV